MSSISGIGSSYSSMQGMGGMKRPDPTKMADELFSKLDTSGQGFIEKSDLKSAFEKITSSSSSSSTQSSTEEDELFAQLDSDSDGKVTKQEFSDAIKKVSDELDSQMMSMRLAGGMSGMGGMPPPPPADDAGMTKEQLTSIADEIGASDSEAASSLNDLISNFDKADSNSDGKVSFQESQAYRESTESTASTSTSTSSTDASTLTADANDKLLKQIIQLMETYGIAGKQSDEQENSLFSSISTTA